MSLEALEEQGEVAAGRGEDGISTVAFAAPEEIALHAVFGLEVADDGLDGGSASLLATDRLGDPARLTRDPDPETVRVVVASIALIDVDTADLNAGELLHLGDDVAESVSVIGVTVQSLGVEHELAALGTGDWGRHGDLATEFVRRPSLALADASTSGT